ncbi:hypothetical protein UREG_01647 [Uncinocarpus reesii 1704]|uniref:Uncharacterized protein n=1 Tax=Uncinocarpus reesii (strain UAMH 1704) TaxID=336963 RepID=C4JJ40_UNCRE|nr:uncharacterized protein UREG_01647 [Uncinocarpus reesii 1704]EEP76798.1 hypothetical protein UREG_01647 [Uncinocarpus reesii 1704]
MNNFTQDIEPPHVGGIKGRWPKINPSKIAIMDQRWFFKYFEEKNRLISERKARGVKLEFNTLGIINGLIDLSIQAPQYIRYAEENTYGIHPLNETIINYMKMANSMPNGCQDQLARCKRLTRTSLVPYSYCSEAHYQCRDNVGNSPGAPRALSEPSQSPKRHRRGLQLYENLES